MGTTRGERLEEVVARLDTLIDQVRARGFDQSALFLEMAKLQLKLEFNGITDEEFGTFCAALESGALTAALRPRVGQPRARHDGDLRAQRRAWNCGNGIAERRVGRRAGR